MLYTDFRKRGVELAEGIDSSKVYPLCFISKEDIVDKIINVFQKFNYDLKSLSLRSFEIFASGDQYRVVKEDERDNIPNSLESILERVQALGLKEVIAENLNIETLDMEVLKRLEVCIAHQIPFLYQDSNLIINDMYYEDLFVPYTGISSTTEVSVNPQMNETHENHKDVAINVEDQQVYHELTKTLIEIKNENLNDGTLGFIIMSILANLENVLANDNQTYKFMGTRHLIETALQDIALTPETQAMVNEKILVHFPDNTVGIERSA